MMSTLKATNLQNASSATTNAVLNTDGTITTGTNMTVTGTAVMSSPYTMRNKIINGAMVIDQRSSGTTPVSVSTGTFTYSVDRFCGTATASSGVFTLSQSTTAPSNHINSLKVTVTTADSSLAATDLYRVGQWVEGFNIVDLGWGTATAQSVTLSFWVYSSLTGTFGGSLINGSANYSYPFSYTISSANTWEQKTITITGPTSGTWLTTNGRGILVGWGLGVGSTYSGTAGSWSANEYYSSTGATSVIGTNAATFYITGVQLERGTVATPFEYRNYQQELAMCQRYFVQFGGDSSNDQVGAGQAFSATAAGATIRFPVTMRANPTLDSFTASNWSVMNGSGGLVAATAIVLAGGQTNRNGTQLSITVASGLTAGQGSSLLANTSSARLPFNSEL